MLTVYRRFHRPADFGADAPHHGFLLFGDADEFCERPRSPRREQEGNATSATPHQRKMERIGYASSATRQRIIYGAGGAIGAAVASAFAREGAKVFLSGRTLSKNQRVADEIVAAGGTAEAFQVDALDEAAVENHVAAVVKAVTGRVDVTFNGITAVPQPGTQGIPIAELSVDAFIGPVTLYMRSHFLTARAAARRMAGQGSGVLLMNTPEPARLGAARIGGMGPAWAAMEALNRNLSAEFGASGVRAICIRPTGMPETETIKVVFGLHADAMGISREQFQAFVEGMTHRWRSTTVAEAAETAAFLASRPRQRFHLDRRQPDGRADRRLQGPCEDFRRQPRGIPSREITIDR